MDLYAYAQIEDLEHYLKDNDIFVPRLRGLRLMKEETSISKEDIQKAIKEAKKNYLVEWLQQHDDWYWSSTKADRKHPAFIYGRDEDSNKVIVDYDFSKVHGKDRKHIKLNWKYIEKRYNTNYSLFNKFAGQDVLYVHSRIGGGNREYYNDDWTTIKKHSLYLGDCDDIFDTTYCDIYFKLIKGD